MDDYIKTKSKQKWMLFFTRKITEHQRNVMTFYVFICKYNQVNENPIILLKEGERRFRDIEKVCKLVQRSSFPQNENQELLQYLQEILSNILWKRCSCTFWKGVSARLNIQLKLTSKLYQFGKKF